MDGHLRNETWSILSRSSREKASVLSTVIEALGVSSFVSKVFMRLKTNNLNETADEQQWLPEAQAAFKKNRCVKDHIFIVNTLMEKQKKNPERVEISRELTRMVKSSSGCKTV